MGSQRVGHDWAIKLNWTVGEDSWESLELQRDQTSRSKRKSTLNIPWKDWCWSWSCNTLATWFKKPTPWKRPWCWERSRAGGEGDDRELDCGMAQWTNSMEMSVSKLQETAKDREAWRAAVNGISKSQTRLSNWTTLQTHHWVCWLQCSSIATWWQCYRSEQNSDWNFNSCPLERLKSEGDSRRRDGWMASPTWWTWVWASSRRWWWTGRPGVLQSLGSQSQTGLNWVEL